MPKEPLYPHVPKSRQPQFPHVPGGRQPGTKLPATEKPYQKGADGEPKVLKHFWVEENKPYGTWAIVEAFPGGTIRSPFDTKEEAIKRVEEFCAAYGYEFKLVPSPQEKFPRQHEVLKGFYPYEIIEYHDDGDLTIQSLEPLPRPKVGFKKGYIFVVTTDGKIFKQERLPATAPQTKEKLYQRGPDGYPIGADKIMRDAWGPIPATDQPFWSGKGFIKPVKIYGWQWSTDYHSWRAYVRFPDGTETWTSPMKQTGGSLELLASTEGDPIRKFCCRQCGVCAPKELLEEGRFLDRISWLRSHYQAKHPGMWGEGGTLQAATKKEFVCPRCGARSATNVFGDILGEKVSREHPYISSLGARVCLANYKGVLRWEALSKEEQKKYVIQAPMTVEDGEPVSPQYRHLTSLVREPLPKDAD